MRTYATQKLFREHIHLPNGFVYRDDFLTKEEELEILSFLKDLPLTEGRNREGYIAKRRVLHFGYDFDEKKMTRSIPPFLLPLKRKIAKWVDIPVSQVVEALVSEYTEGAAIGWHRDTEPCEQVVGISLLGTCRLRLRPYELVGGKRPVTSLTLHPRSAYLLQKDAHYKFQHSIAKVSELRYSITFRTLMR